MRTWTAALRLVEHGRGLAAGAVLIAAVQTLLLVPIAVLVRNIFDRQVPAHDSGAIIRSGLLALGLYALSSGFSVAARGLAIGPTKRAIARLRARVFDRLYALPSGWFDSQASGRIHALVVHDTEFVDAMLNQLLTQVLPAAAVGFVLCVLAAVLSPMLFAALLVVVALMLGAHHLTRARSLRALRASSEALATFNADAQEALESMEAARIHGSEEWSRTQRRGPIAVMTETGSALVRVRSVETATQAALSAAAGMVVLIIGGLAVADGSLSLGTLLAFYAIVALLLRQVGIIVAGAPVVLHGQESLCRVSAFLDEAVPASYEGCRRLTFEGGLRVERGTFAYDGAPVLNDIDLTIGPGEHVALVGPNGAGKSTLVSLLLGTRRPQQGRLLADGVPFEELDLRELRLQMGVVSQQPVLVRATIAENIAWGRVSPASPEVRTAARRATADAFIEALPGGYDTLLGDRGGGLSGGERQRIALARALVGEPALLLLDEPGNHLDAASLDAALAMLETLPRRPSIVTVTHDLEVASRADRVIAIRDGRIESVSPSAGGRART